MNILSVCTLGKKWRICNIVRQHCPLQSLILVLSVSAFVQFEPRNEPKECFTTKCMTKLCCDSLNEPETSYTTKNAFLPYMTYVYVHIIQQLGFIACKTSLLS